MNDLEPRYTIKIIDRTGLASTVNNVTASTWEKVCESAMSGTPLNLSYTNPGKGEPIQIQWGRGSIVRVELIPE
jgi:hypothetical protein